MGYGRYDSQFLSMKIILSILLLISGSLTAQTRFYFDRLITAPISPTINAAWTVTATGVYDMMYPSKTKFWVNTTTATLQSNQAGATPPAKMIIATLISQPLLAQTIATSSTISMQILCFKGTSLVTTALIMYVRLCNQDGTNITEIGNATSTNINPTTPQNRTLSLTLGSDVTVAENQRIIVEIGGSYTVGSTAHRATMSLFLGTAGADLPVDNTTFTQLNPWIEFSQTLLFRQEIGIGL